MALFLTIYPWKSVPNRLIMRARCSQINQPIVKLLSCI